MLQLLTAAKVTAEMSSTFYKKRKRQEEKKEKKRELIKEHPI